MKHLLFSKDDKWNEAKDFIKGQGLADNWIEVVDYYRQIGGKHVAMFIAIDKVKYMVLEATKDNKVILVDKDNNIVLEDYDIVMESKKMFYYIEEPFEVKINIPKHIQDITYNNTVILTTIRGGK
ncbi:portal protein [Staphylococcus phage Stau2]|uniref:Putative portal protein n=1 Tax=Staphylococcus phage Stau2 TaxID=1200862 RepID=A0A0U1ZU98_9CAUD|nr:portal protein [Staphylococcus phage Stau2]AKA61270.1 putative portal protein [Staphylococcus phage Stau2]